MAKGFEPKFDYKHISLKEMMEYIEAEHPEDKEWFKEVAFQDKYGHTVNKYNHLNAKQEFCKKYAPGIIPKRKEKEEPLSNKLANW